MKNTVLNKLDKTVEMYLDYFNNFLTVSRFAEYYGISEEEANQVIKIGRMLNNTRKVVHA